MSDKVFEITESSSKRTMDSSALNSARLWLAVVCFFWLNGSVWSQKSPCPDVFSYKVDPDSSQTYGLIELRDQRNTKTIRLMVELFFNIAIEMKNLVSIGLVKSNRQTLRDIQNNRPAQYRINFPPADSLPAMLKIAVNGQTICTGMPPAGSTAVAPIALEHTMYSPMQTASNRNNNNRGQIQEPTIPFYRPPVQQIATVEDLLTVSLSDVGCGTMSSVRNRRSTNGVRQDRGQFPWAAPIFRVRQMTSTEFLCGSTIITILHVVTAAACVYSVTGEMIKPDELSVVPGMYNIDSFFENTNQVRSVAKVHVHSEFDYEEIFIFHHEDLSDTNIAVLKLNEPIRFNDVVRPVCVWDETNDLSRIVGQLGFVSGWGSSGKLVGDSGISRYPSFVNATIIDKRECSRQLDKPIKETSRMFCANGNGGVPCVGDIGNGLVLQRGSRFYLRGIVLNGQLNWETRLCDIKKPVIYMDVAPFRFWLVGILKM